MTSSTTERPALLLTRHPDAGLVVSCQLGGEGVWMDLGLGPEARQGDIASTFWFILHGEAPAEPTWNFYPWDWIQQVRPKRLVHVDEAVPRNRELALHLIREARRREQERRESLSRIPPRRRRPRAP